MAPNGGGEWLVEKVEWKLKDDRRARRQAKANESEHSITFSFNDSLSLSVFVGFDLIQVVRESRLKEPSPVNRLRLSLSAAFALCASNLLIVFCAILRLPVVRARALARATSTPPLFLYLPHWPTLFPKEAVLFVVGPSH